MTSAKVRIDDFLTKFSHNVDKPILKDLCKFQVDMPVNARVRAVQNLENPIHFIAVAAMLPTNPFSHTT